MSRTAWVSDPYLESRQQLLTLLTEAGWHAISSALDLDVEHIKAAQPDAIFIRQEREGTLGGAILSKLKTHIPVEETALILVSSDMTTADIERHQQRDGAADAYLKLPFDRVDIDEVLEGISIQRHAFSPSETHIQPIEAGALELDISIEGTDGTLIDVQALQKSNDAMKPVLNPSAEAFVEGILQKDHVPEHTSLSEREQDTIDRLRDALKTSEDKLIEFQRRWTEREEQIESELERSRIAKENQHRAEKELVEVRKKLEQIEANGRQSVVDQGAKVSALHDAHLENERLYLKTVAELESQLALEKETHKGLQKQLESLKDQRRDQHQHLSNTLADTVHVRDGLLGSLKLYAEHAEWAVAARDRRRQRVQEDAKKTVYVIDAWRERAQYYAKMSSILQYQLKERLAEQLRRHESSYRVLERRSEERYKENLSLKQQHYDLEAQNHRLGELIESYERQRLKQMSTVSRQLWKADDRYQRLREAYLRLKREHHQHGLMLQNEQAMGAAAIHMIDKRRRQQKAIAQAVVDRLSQQKKTLEQDLQQLHAAHQHDVNTLRDELQNVRTIANEQVSELDAKQAEVMQLTKSNKKLSERGDGYQKELAYAKEVADNLKETQAQNEHRIKILEEESENRARIVQGLKGELDRQVEQHAQASQQFVALRGGLESQIKAALSKEKSLEKTITKVQFERGQLSDDVKNKKRIITEKNRELSELKNVVAAEQEAKAAVKKQLTILESEHQAILQQLKKAAALNQKIPGLEKDVIRLEESVQKAEERGRRLTQKIARDEESIGRLRAELVDEKQASLALVHQVTTLRETEDRLTASLTGKTRAWKELQEKSKEAAELWRQERDRLRAAIRDILGPVERVARYIESDADRLRDMEQHLVDVRALIREEPSTPISRPVRRIERQDKSAETPFAAQHTAVEMELLVLATADEVSQQVSTPAASNPDPYDLEALKKTQADISISDFDKRLEQTPNGDES